MRTQQNAAYGEDAFNEGREFMLTFLAENSAHFAAAPDANLITLRDGSYAIIARLAEDSTTQCADFATTGVQADDLPGAPLMRRIAQVSADQIAAIAAGRRNPVQRAAATQADFDLLFAQMQENGASPAQINALLAHQTMALPVEQQCTLGVSLYKSLTEVSHDASTRLSVVILGPV